MTGEPRYAPNDPPVTASLTCLDCGAAVMDETAHTRFHSILSLHARTLAVLKTSHIAAHVHEKYDVAERIDSRKFDSWSADALAEVISRHGTEDP